MFEAEDVLMEDKPLKRNRRTIIKEPTNEDERRIQEEFKDFDFKAREEDKANREALLKEALAREQTAYGQGSTDFGDQDEDGEDNGCDNSGDIDGSSDNLP